MAEMSKLAYLKFEMPQENDLKKLAEAFAETPNIPDIEKILKENLIPNFTFIIGKGEEALRIELKKAQFDLVRTFNSAGTQAFLAKREKDKIAVLAFRGTEKEQFKDLITDLKAQMTRTGGDSKGKGHTGFLEAFQTVERPIREEVDKLDDYALYITGHSLGGALAVIATAKLEKDNTAACYTFGGPRVGSSEFGEAIRAPIYRLVNTADVVPRLPPGLSIEIAVDVLRFARVVLPFCESIADWLDNKVSGYRHFGDMRYLTNCEKPDYSDVRLIFNITFLARWRRLIRSQLSPKRRLQDHAISEYCKKLAAYLGTPILLPLQVRTPLRDNTILKEEDMTQRQEGPIEGWTANRCTALVLGILKGETSVAEVAQKYGLDVAEVEGWQEQFLHGAENSLRRHPKDEEGLTDEHIKTLKQKIGDLVVENDVLREAMNP